MRPRWSSGAFVVPPMAPWSVPPGLPAARCVRSPLYHVGIVLLRALPRAATPSDLPHLTPLAAMHPPLHTYGLSGNRDENADLRDISELEYMGTVGEAEKKASGVSPGSRLQCLVTEEPAPESEQGAGGGGAVLEAPGTSRRRCQPLVAALTQPHS